MALSSSSTKRRFKTRCFDCSTGGGFGTGNIVGTAVDFSFLQPSVRLFSYWLDSKCSSQSRLVEVGTQFSRRQFTNHLFLRSLSVGKGKSLMPFSDLLWQLGALQPTIVFTCVQYHKHKSAQICRQKKLHVKRHTSSASNHIGMHQHFQLTFIRSPNNALSLEIHSFIHSEDLYSGSSRDQKD